MVINNHPPLVYQQQNPNTYSSWNIFDKELKAYKSQRTRICDVGHCLIHGKDAVSTTFQQSGFLNQTCIKTTPVDKPTGIRRISQECTSHWRTTYNHWFLTDGESVFSMDKTSEWLSNSMQSALNSCAYENHNHYIWIQ